MDVMVASSLPSRLRGLFGRRDFAGVLMLVPCNDVHTFGMRKPIDVAFVTDSGFVIESHRQVSKRRRLRCRRARATLERFARDGPWYEPGDRISFDEVR